MKSQELQLQKLREILKDPFSTPEQSDAARKSIFRIINEKEVLNK